MREIKFRAWDRKKKTMEKVSYLDWDRKGKVGFLDREKDFERFRIEVKLMQFTGLKDKNGKEIYEGDIVKVLDRDWSDAEKDTRTLIVYFHHGMFELVSKEGISELKKDIPDIYNMKWITARIYKEYGRDRFEIIGNIYENPELLA